VEFTLDSVTIFDMHDNSKIVVGEVNHQYCLYTFSKFISKCNSNLLLIHVDDTSRLWDEIFVHLDFKYMQQLCKKDMVTEFLNIQFSKGFFQGCILGKHPQENFEKGKAWRESSPLALIHSDLMGPFPHLSIIKERYVLTFIDDLSRYTWGLFSQEEVRSF
jgi:hypothetical protein